MKKITLLATIILITVVTSCIDNNPILPNTRQTQYYPPSAEFEFCREALDIFYIFRDELPKNPYMYKYPEELFATLKDQYTVYYKPQKAQEFLDYLTTKTAGLGILIDSTENGYAILKVIKNSPAETAGFLANDTIISVNGSSVIGVSVNTFLNTLDGEIGDTVILEILRDSTKSTIKAELNTYLAPSVYDNKISNNTLYIQLREFTSNTNVKGGSYEEFKTSLENATNSQNIIVDIRYNGGGELSQCLDITNEFLPTNTAIIKVEERNLNINTGKGFFHDTIWYTDSKYVGLATTQKIYILTDRYTASASEIFVSALKNNRPNDVVIIGEKTYGKGRGQILLSTPDSGLAKITSLLLSPISGPDYDLVGITPDVKCSPEFALDSALSLIDRNENVAKTTVTNKMKILRKISNIHRQNNNKWIPLAIRFKKRSF